MPPPRPPPRDALGLTDGLPVAEALRRALRDVRGVVEGGRERLGLLERVEPPPPSMAAPVVGVEEADREGAGV